MIWLKHEIHYAVFLSIQNDILINICLLISVFKSIIFYQISNNTIYIFNSPLTHSDSWLTQWFQWYCSCLLHWINCCDQHAAIDVMTWRTFAFFSTPNTIIGFKTHIWAMCTIITGWTLYKNEKYCGFMRELRNKNQKGRDNWVCLNWGRGPRPLYVKIFYNGSLKNLNSSLSLKSTVVSYEFMKKTF